MTLEFTPVTGLLAELDLLSIGVAGGIAHVRLNRPAKRNALNDALIAQLHTCFINLPDSVNAVVLSGAGDHFCAGLDLSELSDRSVSEGMLHSRTWHATMDAIQFGRVPVVAVLHGAVVGGGLEVASSCHIRVAEASTFYGLPEGQRGIFVGGGGSVRLPRLCGVATMTDMMLTGRVLDSQEGLQRGLAQYAVADGAGFAKATELAARIAGNAPLATFAVLQALPRIADLSQSDGLFVESLMAAIVQGDDAAKERMRDFLEKRAARSANRHDDMTTGARYRELALGGSLEANFVARADGTTLVTSTEPLQPYPRRLTDRLLHWAQADPDHTLAAQRVSDGQWRRLSYAPALHGARGIAQALLDLGLSAQQPVAILSDNDLEHLLLSLGAMLAGVPFAPISPAYSTLSQDHGKLRDILALLTPGLVFASNASAYGRAISAAVPAATPVVLTNGTLDGRATLSFADLAATPATSAVDAAHEAVGPDTIAKFLFTSGSTKAPKAVINTQRMWCANQQQIVQCFPELGRTRPVLVDWLPWNHTFGGNHNVGLTIYNGGTLYIDEGKPTPQLIGQTLRNLREISPTVYFNVPKGFEEIANAMEHDRQLRETLFARVKMFFFAGAGLAQPVWDKLDAIGEGTCGERIRVLTGLGMTETAPFAICANAHEVKSGHIGLPAPGMELKLVPSGDKVEVRYRGPNVTPGYWRAPEQTATAFDAEGFYCSGDAVKLISPADPGRGFMFDGRIAEDFKLATGTFVSVGPLRARVVAAGDPCVQDVVITGIDRNEIGLLIFPRLDACRALAGLADGAPLDQVLEASEVRDFFQRLIDSLWAGGTGSATRVARALVLADPPSIDRGEVTDKGSINQRAVLKQRDAFVQQLYADSAPGMLLAKR